LDIKNTPFYVVDKLTEWKSDDLPRRAGLNSFGVGGTNAHAILEEAPSAEPSDKSRPCQLLLFSAKTATALEKTLANVLRHLKQNSQQSIADVAYTLQIGRRGFNHRAFLVADDLNDAMKRLEPDSKGAIGGVCSQKERSVVFMFPGQGSQYINMGLDLYRNERTFQESIDRCAEILRPLLGLDLRHVMYPEHTTEKNAAELNQTALAQPAIFAVEYALANLWMEWGIRPKAMVGHSVGEFVAACLAGVFNLEDAVRLLAVRGRLMQQLPKGAMLAVGLPEHELAPLLGRDVCLAAVNGPSNCVAAGPRQAIEALEKELSERTVQCRYLHTSHAFHSSMMDPILEQFRAEVRKLKLLTPRIPFISSCTGTWITPEEATDPNYWTTQIRNCVRFHAARQELAKNPDDILLEIGPGRTLASLARHPSYRLPSQVVLASLESAREAGKDMACLLAALGRLWLAAVPIDWDGFYSRERRSRVSLPTYPFERKRYWIDMPKVSEESESQRCSVTNVNDNHSLEPAAAAHTSRQPATESQARTPTTIVERIMSEQLEIMSRQIEMLSYSQRTESIGGRDQSL
jgi:acyl transferase domain-containing protein